MYVCAAAVLNPVTYGNESRIDFNHNILAAELILNKTGAKTFNWIYIEKIRSRENIKCVYM